MSYLLTFFLLDAVLGGGVLAGYGERGLDVLDAFKVLNSSLPRGVSLIRGPFTYNSAFLLKGDDRNVRLPAAVSARIITALRAADDITFTAGLKQEPGNAGTILSFSDGLNRFLEIQSSGRKNEVRLHYTHAGSVHVETFPYGLADSRWHKIALTISGDQVSFFVDCQKIYTRVIYSLDRSFSADGRELSLWVGQRNGKHFFFKGALQEVIIYTSRNGYLRQCPALDSYCPTCGQFEDLQQAVHELQSYVKSLTTKLLATEERLSRVEACDCQKSCHVNGSIHPDGATWQHDCKICSCVRGDIVCRPVQCPAVTCKNPVKTNGECCPTCLQQCLLRGVLYDHGESVSPRQCVDCECRDGTMQCRRLDPDTMCPKLDCPEELQYHILGECCKLCPGVDHCSHGHNCPDNTTCRSIQTTYVCDCKPGFARLRENCIDIDECRPGGGARCGANTRCLNVVGGYRCECLPGFRRIGPYSCSEHDECLTGEHKCHPNAMCTNTQGSYHCQCQEGWKGDGFTCKPVCESGCLNGGECVSPRVCACRRGYVGPSCELDLDECALGLHQCHPRAECVNMPGWYYCRCRHGYHSYRHDTSLGLLCQDMDECETGQHTCHDTAQCVNTDGGYLCQCTNNHTKQCSYNCIYEEREYRDGDSWESDVGSCSKCGCSGGVVSCAPLECDCSRLDISTQCCPQCDTSSTCPHQELANVEFRNGDKWVYQCQTCECLHGEVDCWPMECPPLYCDNPVRSPGDCCLRCEEDPCHVDLNVTSNSPGRPCNYLGQTVPSGQQLAPLYDKCATCNCKIPFCDTLDGRLCCSFDAAICNNSSSNPEERKPRNVESTTNSKQTSEG